MRLLLWLMSVIKNLALCQCRSNANGGKGGVRGATEMVAPVFDAQQCGALSDNSEGDKV